MAQSFDEILAGTRLPTQVRELCAALREASAQTDLAGVWPAELLRQLSAAGVYRWFIPEEFGGLGWDEERIIAGYLALSRSCLTTTFILTQWNAACRRILGGSNAEMRARVLPAMAEGVTFATVGISHLSTSRQHLRKPVLTATPTDGGYTLDGFSPWVTGAAPADLLVLGATLPDGRQLLCGVPTERAGVTCHPGQQLVALSASCTDRVDLRDVRISEEEVIAGPVQGVLQSTSDGGAGGLQTSLLALGLASSAIAFLNEQASSRADLQPIADKLANDFVELHGMLLAIQTGVASATPADLRQRCNSLVLRGTQAALSAAKGAGFLATHPTGRWAREALFFLVWSCPQPVMAANLCELAQLA